MPSHAARSHRSDVYPLALASAGTACLVVAFALLLARPAWETQVLDLPLSAYLLGGAGGLLTIVACPAWARRLGSRNPGRVVAFTLYRLCIALGMGAAGYSAVLSLAQTLSLVTPDWFPYMLALLSGVLECMVNEVVLRSLGFLAPKGIDPRLL